MIQYFFWYVLLGIVIALYLYIFQYQRPSAFAKKVYENLESKKPWHYTLREKLVIPGTMIFITTCWPIALYMILKDLIQKLTINKQKSDTYSFIARHEHVQEECSVADVEKQNIYFDPQNAVPKIPFGHMNKAWSNFIFKKLPSDKLHKFIASRNSTCGEYSKSIENDVRGYVLIRNGKIIAEFIYESL